MYSACTELPDPSTFLLHISWERTAEVAKWGGFGVWNEWAFVGPSVASFWDLEVLATGKDVGREGVKGCMTVTRMRTSLYVKWNIGMNEFIHLSVDVFLSIHLSIYLSSYIYHHSLSLPREGPERGKTWSVRGIEKVTREYDKTKWKKRKLSGRGQKKR